jgi:hypothetical protein
MKNLAPRALAGNCSATLHGKYFFREDFSRKGAKAQRRKALPRSKGFLCAFAPLRERSSRSSVFHAKPVQALQRRKAKCAVELAVELVVLAQGYVHYPLQLFEIIYVDYGVDVVEKCSVCVHGAQ